VGVATVVGLALTGGLGAAVWGLSVAIRERNSAQAAELDAKRDRTSAEKVTEFMQQMFAAIDPEIAQSRDAGLLKLMLDAAAERIERGELRDSPTSEAELRVRMASVYRTLAENERAEQIIAPAAEMMERARPGDLSARERVLEGLSALASARGRHNDAIRLGTELLELRRSLFGAEDGRVATALSAIGSNLFHQGKLKDAEAACTEALRIAGVQKDPATLGDIHNHLMAIYQAMGRLKEAARQGDMAIESLRDAGPGDHPQLAITMTSLVAVRGLQLGQFDEAEAMQREAIDMFRRLFPGGHPNLGTGLNNLGWILKAKGKNDEAGPLFTEALDIVQRYGDEQGALAAQIQINLGQIAMASGDWTLAERRAREALETCRRVFPQGHYITSFALSDLGKALREQGRYDQSAASYREATALQRQLLGPTNAYVATSLTGLAETLARQGRGGEGVAPLREVLSIRRGAKPPDRAAIASVQAQLAGALAVTGTLADAREGQQLAEECLATREELLKPDDWRLDNTRSILGATILAGVVLDAPGPPRERAERLDEARLLIIPAADRFVIHPELVPAPAREVTIRAALQRAVALCEALVSADPAPANAESLALWRRRQREFAPVPSATGG
jgi:tetratricopeptide (TPR) repeat protein